jgi:hypothetical protein
VHTGQEQTQPDPFETAKDFGEPAAAVSSQWEEELACRATGSTDEAQKRALAEPNARQTETYAITQQQRMGRQVREEL